MQWLKNICKFISFLIKYKNGKLLKNYNKWSILEN